VVVKEENKTVLYCKGKPDDIMERMNLNKETQKTIDSAMSSYKNKKA
jgi:magnesium-transporting ATPase (P-type)